MPPTDAGRPFGEGGAVVTASQSRSRDHVAAFFHDDQDRLVIVADAESGGTLIARVTIKGELDPTFGIGGIAFDARARPGKVIRHPDGVMEIVDAVAAARVAADGSALPGFAPSDVDRALMASALATGDRKGRIVTANQNLDALVLKRTLPSGAVDATFGDAGQVTLPLSGTHETSVYIDPITGRLLVTSVLGANTSFVVAAFHDDGSVDESFGSNGSQTHSAVAFTPRGGSLRVGPTGAWLLGGVGYLGGSTPAVGATQLTSTGAIDVGYGAVGVGLSSDARREYIGMDASPAGAVTIATRTHIHRLTAHGSSLATVEICPALATFPPTPCVRKGPLVDAADGFSFVSDEDDVVVVRRRDAQSAVDTDFGQDGAFEIPFTAGSEAIGTLIATDVGDLLAIGDESSPLSARYSATGELEPAFGAGGLRKGAAGPAARFSNGDVVVLTRDLVRWTPTGAQESWFTAPSMIPVGVNAALMPRAVAVDTSDRVIAIGNAAGPRGPHGAMARLNGTGALDTTFASTGTYDCPVDGTSFDRVAVAKADAVVVVGSAWVAPQRHLLIAQFDATGAGDPSFGSQGIAVVDATPFSFEEARAAVSDPRGLIVLGVAGEPSPTAPSPPTVDDVPNRGLVLARFTPTGALDPTFGTKGVVQGSDWVGFDARDLAVDATGSIYVAGRWSTSPRARGGFVVLRFTPDGRVDPTFGEAGLVAPFGEPGGAQALAVASDGAVYAGGYVYRSPSGRDFAVARVREP